jgi:hypothetical protein
MIVLLDESGKMETVQAAILGCLASSSIYITAIDERILQF